MLWGVALRHSRIEDREAVFATCVAVLGCVGTRVLAVHQCHALQQRRLKFITIECVAPQCAYYAEPLECMINTVYPLFLPGSGGASRTSAGVVAFAELAILVGAIVSYTFCSNTPNACGHRGHRTENYKQFSTSVGILRAYRCKTEPQSATKVDQTTLLTGPGAPVLAAAEECAWSRPWSRGRPSPSDRRGSPACCRRSPQLRKRHERAL